MSFLEPGTQSVDESKKGKLLQSPHIKTASLFGVVLFLFAMLFIFGIDKNETRHLSVKPNAQQAYSMAQSFVKDKLKLPASADFSKNNFHANIDTSTNTYVLNGYVNAQSVGGRFIKQQWTTKLKFTGGDWANRKSWQVELVDID
ncbi:hypothetical protein BDD43_3625 [Mucilaginibacter gracilis]|uniref:Cytochrome oxidase complex assembly protein 1 n=1 Tax=Mucilaginibacter gracilis TaxID=423350 RepID=A0A495J3A4_9SPHI|nr:hypothetical protein [Mucilaginibacter gracilis]RKR83417.1 hypothetical protein BDD43_3625 [Mucilaginibacter gracilis]